MGTCRLLCSLTLTALCVAWSSCTTDYKENEGKIHMYAYKDFNMNPSPDNMFEPRYRQNLKDHPTVMRNATELKANMKFTPKKVIQALKALAVELSLDSAVIITERRLGTFFIL